MTLRVSLLQAPAWVETVALVLGLCLLAVTLRFDIDGDGAVRYEMLRTVVEAHQLPATKYSLIQPLAAIPLYVVGKALGHPDHIVPRFNLLIFAALTLFVYRRLSPIVAPALLRRWFLLMLACSMFPHHLRMFYGEVFSAAAGLAGLTLILTGALGAGSAALCLAAMNSPALLVPIAFLAIALAWNERRGLYLVLPVIGLLGVLLEAWVRRGSPLLTGYEHEHGFRYPFVLGVASILFSFGKGLLLFAPGLLLSVEFGSDEVLQRLHRLSMLFVVGLIVVYAKWWAWYGGWFWGPRFFLFASIPASLAIVLRLREQNTTVARDVALLAALLMAIWVGLDGAIFGVDVLARIGVGDNYAREALTWYVPEFSPLWYPFLEHRAIHLARLRRQRLCPRSRLLLHRSFSGSHRQAANVPHDSLTASAVARRRRRRRPLAHDRGR
jgi:hypothetical protein